MFRRKRDERAALKQELQESLQEDLEVYKENLMRVATAQAQEVLLRDPVFAEAYKTKIEFEKRQRELDTVLDFGMTERVIRQLVEGAVAKQCVVTITWPSWLDENGGRCGGQIMSTHFEDRVVAAWPGARPAQIRAGARKLYDRLQAQLRSQKQAAQQ